MTVTFTTEEQELIVFALGVMLGRLGTTPELTAIVEAILKKLEEADATPRR